MCHSHCTRNYPFLLAATYKQKMKGLIARIPLFPCITMLLTMLLCTRTISVLHQLQATHLVRQDKEAGSLNKMQSMDNYLDSDADTEGIEIRYLESIVQESHQQHTVKRDSPSSECGQESLESILMSCQESVTLNTSVLSNTDVNQTALLRMQFCGSGCRTKMLLRAFSCGINSYIVEVSGYCKYWNRDAACIHAAVIMNHGTLWCTIELSHGHEVEPTLSGSAEEKMENSTDRCSLSTLYSTEVQHNIVYDPLQGKHVLSPPLDPPWQNCSAFVNSRDSSTTTTGSTPTSTSPNPDSNQTSDMGFKGPTATTNGCLRHCSQTYLTISFYALCCLVVSKVVL